MTIPTSTATSAKEKLCITILGHFGELEEASIIEVYTDPVNNVAELKCFLRDKDGEKARSVTLSPEELNDMANRLKQAVRSMKG